MASFSMEDLKTLRERLGTGMVDTKNALTEANGDLEKATEILRLKGAKGNAKRADRSTSEGLVAAKEENGTATLIELACETDFVAKGDKFVALAAKVLDAVSAAGATSVEAGLAAPAILGEKIELRRLAAFSGDKFSIYLHQTSQDLPPQVGVVVAYTGDDAETARAIAQHISFADPVYLSRADVPAEDIEKERAIVTEISRNEGKPEAQLALLEQEYSRDNKFKVQQVVDNAGITITGFARFKVGA
jgi:elongation factor Ts